MTATDASLAAFRVAVDEYEPTVRAWQYLAPEITLAQAAGPLAGEVVGVKDIIDAAGMPCTCGSPIHAGRVAARDAECVGRLRNAGAIIPGKTVTTEFATFKPPVTTNPHDSARTPGGSSSGSAAAVAAGMVRFALGSQTAGSVIRPAAFCGVAGFKPTFGLVSLAGVQPLATSLDTLGWFARSAADLTQLATVFGIAAADSAAPARIALCRTPEWEQTDAATRDWLDAALAAFAAAGAETTTLTMTAPFDRLNEAQNDIMTAEAAVSLARERAERGALLSEGLRNMLDRGARMAPQRLEEAHAHAARCRARESDLFGAADLLLTAAAPGEAPPRETTGDPVFNRPWTLLHVPCVTLPFGSGSAGLPLGVQLVARRGADAELLSWARWAEAALA